MSWIWCCGGFPGTEIPGLGHGCSDSSIIAILLTTYLLLSTVSVYVPLLHKVRLIFKISLRDVHVSSLRDDACVLFFNLLRI
jgi:hypothetical protein